MTRPGEPKSIVGHALLPANVEVDDLGVMRSHRVRDLYREARLPVDLTRAIQASHLGGSRRVPVSRLGPGVTP
jgi:hypothetical protein